LQQWHQGLVSTAPMINAAGDMHPKTLTPLIETFLADLPIKNSAPVQPIAPPEWPTLTAPIAISKEVPQTVVTLGLPALARDDAQFYAQYIMNQVLGGGGLTSRLSNKIRQENGLAYYAGSRLSLRNESAVLLVRFATRSDQADKAIALARATLHEMAQNGITQAEFENARDYITGSFPLRLDRLESQLAYLNIMQLHGLGTDYLQQRNTLFEQTTQAEVNEVAAKLLAKTPLIVLVGNTPSPSESE